MCEKQPLVQVLAWVIFCICTFILSWKGHHTSLPVWICLHKLPSRLKCAKINYNYWQLPVKSLCHCEHCSSLNWGLFQHEPLSFHIYLILQWSYCVIWHVLPSSSLELQRISSNQWHNLFEYQWLQCSLHRPKGFCLSSHTHHVHPCVLGYGRGISLKEMASVRKMVYKRSSTMHQWDILTNLSQSIQSL